MTVDETPPSSGGSSGSRPTPPAPAASSGTPGPAPPIRVLDTTPPALKYPTTTSTSTTTTATVAGSPEANVQASKTPVKRPSFEDYLVTQKDKAAEMFSQINEITGEPN